ncbi:hypothetical protein VCRA2122O10_280001 [Vibrio crassostreae]|nr:hypothetical protein VCRA2122O10_280001 [Vibrio crassostreae]CAK3848008.1 hypothetical protein VCRA2120O6_290001 [Vibrio crassostreae]
MMTTTLKNAVGLTLSHLIVLLYIWNLDLQWGLLYVSDARDLELKKLFEKAGTNSYPEPSWTKSY